jgi:hypothetical protein
VFANSVLTLLDKSTQFKSIAMSVMIKIIYIYIFFFIYICVCPLTRGRACNLLHNCFWASQIYPQALGSLFVASYDSQGYTEGILIKVEVTLRPTVSRPVCLGVRRPSGTRDQFYFLLEILFR